MFRNIIHIHIPAFPIAVARVVEPRLRGRPVAVALPHSERSLITCVSLEARQEGVYRGMPVSSARALCPHLKVISPNPDLTQRAYHAVEKLAACYTPVWEPARPGHIYLDLTGTERLWGRAKDTAYRLNREVKARLELSGTAGVASNKMVSSIASRILPKEEQILDVARGQEPGFMAPLRITMLPGIGRFQVKLLLEDLNILRVGQLAALDMETLHLIFGPRAQLIHQRAMGIDPTPVYPLPKKPVISEHIIFAEDENDNETLLAALYQLVEKCASRLRQKGQCAQRAGIFIRYSDHVEARRHCRLPSPGFWEFQLYEPVKKIFLKACTRRVRVRFMKVWFSEFCGETKQLPLFSKGTDRWAEKRKAIIQALDRIRERYGEKVIGYAKIA